VQLKIGETPLTHLLDQGNFTESSWLTADFYNPHSVILQIKLQFLPVDEKRVGEIIFGLYPQVRARLRIPGTALAMNAWLLPREGALLKPMCGGDIVRAEEVHTLRITLIAGPESTAGWWQTPWTIRDQAPEKLVQAESEHPYLLDALGQNATRTWPDKTADETEMIQRLRSETATDATFPATWTRWGGSTSIRFEATGFFRTHHDGKRWWLVDPDGGAFWSTGLCCVAPLAEAAVSGLEHLLPWKPDESAHWADARRIRLEGPNSGKAINFLAANFIRTFGPESWRNNWRHLTAGFLRKRRFNTIGNWSDWELGRDAALPYTRPLRDIDTMPIPKIFRDFPDVFHPDFSAACAEWAKQLEVTKDDPAFIGYFICNEPTWGFAKQTPAAGMLANSTQAFTRNEFAAWLKQRHGATPLTVAWQNADALETRLLEGTWTTLPQNATFQSDVEAFSAVMVARLFDSLSTACRAVDPNHLNLGARFAHVPHDWMMPSLGSFDVFSFNSYSKKPRPAGAEISSRLNRPVLIGEWHFGAADTGLPAAGLETVATQHDRGLAYRHYLEAHAANPWCVGVHWFTLYDQSALGRFDGEAYNCGFLDVCHREQQVISEAAQASHEILYSIASGLKEPSSLPEPRYIRRLSL
jgi:hypothetical protein